MQEILDVAQESTNVSSKLITVIVGASILSLGIIDLLIIAPDDTSIPFPVSYIDEAFLLGTGLLIINQSGAVEDIKNLI
jgi:hypothetical protein